MWGAIMPTKPTGPHAATIPPTITEVARKRRVRVRATATPRLAAISDRLPFVVDEIIGIAEIDGGQNGFRVEAHLETATGDLRPGMRGVGKIEIDERSRLWVWGHRLYERMSLLLWSHLP